MCNPSCDAVAHCYLCDLFTRWAQHVVCRSLEAVGGWIAASPSSHCLWRPECRRIGDVGGRNPNERIQNLADTALSIIEILAGPIVLDVPRRIVSLPLIGFGLVDDIWLLLAPFTVPLNCAWTTGPSDPVV